MTRVIVLGAGTAGCVAAKVCAQNGLDTTIVERKPRRDIGDKVCGDGIEGRFEHLYAKYARPPKEGALHVVRKAVLRARGREQELRIEDVRITMVDRKAFGQRLLEEAEAAGARLVHDRVVGWARGGVATGRGVMFGLVIDCSGWNSRFRSDYLVHHPDAVEHRVDAREVATCYRAVVHAPGLAPDDAAVTEFGDDMGGGYLWTFPYGDGTYNVGAGCLAGPNAADTVRRAVARVVGGNRMLRSAGGIVPVSTPMRSAVADGVMFAGDAAYHTHSVTGGGISISMAAGGMAAETALEADDMTKESLWPYNGRFFEPLGRMLWSTYPLARFIRTLNGDDIAALFAALGGTDTPLTPTDAARVPGLIAKLGMLLRHPALAARSMKYAAASKAMSRLECPTPRNVRAWSANADAKLAKVR